MQREITREMVKARLPRREADTNKGSFGSVLAAAGSMAYRGAAALCAEGALRAGAGLVYLASVEPVVQMVLSRTPECCACSPTPTPRWPSPPPTTWPGRWRSSSGCRCPAAGAAAA